MNAMAIRVIELKQSGANKSQVTHSRKILFWFWKHNSTTVVRLAKKKKKKSHTLYEPNMTHAKPNLF